MVKVLFEGVEVDRCADCHGLWFDRFEREALLKRRDSEAIDNGNAQLGSQFDCVDCIVCPRCGTRMIRMVALGRRPRIHFEQCPLCAGSFFDAGEFTYLKQHPTICLPA